MNFLFILSPRGGGGGDVLEVLLGGREGEEEWGCVNSFRHLMSI